MVQTSCANKLCKQAVQTSCDKVWLKAACQAAKISSPRTRIGKSEEPLKRQALLTLPKSWDLHRDNMSVYTYCLGICKIMYNHVHVAKAQRWTCKGQLQMKTNLVDSSEMRKTNLVDSSEMRSHRERERERTPIYLQQLIKSQLCLQHSLHQECQLQEILGNTKCEQQEDQFHPICIAILSTGNLRRRVRDEN